MPSYQILPQIDFFNNTALKEIQSRDLSLQILELNETTAEYGFVLSEKDAAELVQTRNKSLYDNDRIEMSIGIVAKIIEKFSKSSFVNQSNYAETLNELLDVFYYVKSEARDKISDNDLLDRLYDYYENKCYGSMELMTGREIEILLRYIHRDKKSYDLEEEDDYGSEPEWIDPHMGED